MAKILEIKKRIESTSKIGRVTNAMQLVSASRFHQSFQKTKASRPYVNHLKTMLASIRPDVLDRLDHPFLHTRKSSAVKGLLMLGSHKGLCGSLNHRLVKKVLSDLELTKKSGQTHYLCWTHGEKLRALMASLGITPVGHSNATSTKEGLFDCFFEAVNQYRNGTIGSLYVCYHDYKTLMHQEPTVTQLLPIPRGKRSWEKAERWSIYEWEPDVYRVADFLLTQFVRANFYQALLENNTSEHAARMVAMKTATDNASRIVDQTKLLYNNVRQAIITQEIIEIVSGAQET